MASARITHARERELTRRDPRETDPRPRPTALHSHTHAAHAPPRLQLHRTHSSRLYTSRNTTHDISTLEDEHRHTSPCAAFAGCERKTPSADPRAPRRPGGFVASCRAGAREMSRARREAAFKLSAYAMEDLLAVEALPARQRTSPPQNVSIANPLSRYAAFCARSARHGGRGGESHDGRVRRWREFYL